MTSTIVVNQVLPKERPIGKRALDAVDAYFEECSFTEAIHALDQACSPSYAPHEQHIRQLLYVAMYPHPRDTTTPNFDAQTTDKLGKNKIDRQKMNHPTPSDSAAALRVLHKFTTVNTPESVLKGIASYAVTSSAVNEDLPDSNVASLALKFKHCKDCWSILKPGFLSTDTEESNLASPKRKRRHIAKIPQAGTDSLVGEVLVDENAWPILHWLLCTFEKDERATAKSVGVLYSPLLTLQIPFPRDSSTDVERKELNGLLNLILFAFRQPQMDRKRLGARLLTLLINLGSTVHVNPDTLAGSLRWRLSFGAACEDLVNFAAISAALPPTIPVLIFKLLLCRRRITSLTNEIEEDIKPRPKPLGRRAVPKPISQATVASPTPSPASSEVRILRKYPIPAALEIKRLFCVSQEAAAEVIQLSSVACTMLISYDILQKLLTTEDKDRDWDTVKKDICGALRSCIGVDSTIASEYGHCAILLDSS